MTQSATPPGHMDAPPFGSLVSTPSHRRDHSASAGTLTRVRRSAQALFNRSLVRSSHPSTRRRGRDAPPQTVTEDRGRVDPHDRIGGIDVTGSGTSSQAPVDACARKDARLARPDRAELPRTLVVRPRALSMRHKRFHDQHSPTAVRARIRAGHCDRLRTFYATSAFGRNAVRGSGPAPMPR
jgi:hypothetical protein